MAILALPGGGGFYDDDTGQIVDYDPIAAAAGGFLQGHPDDFYGYPSIDRGPAVPVPVPVPFPVGAVPPGRADHHWPRRWAYRSFHRLTHFDSQRGCWSWRSRSRNGDPSFLHRRAARLRSCAPSGRSWRRSCE